MYDDIDLEQRLIIIRNSGLDDATILDENYKQLIVNTPDPIVQSQFVILRSTVQRRIEELTLSRETSISSNN
jgi:hypothetical protein